MLREKPGFPGFLSVCNSWEENIQAIINKKLFVAMKMVVVSDPTVFYFLSKGNY